MQETSFLDLVALGRVSKKNSARIHEVLPDGKNKTPPHGGGVKGLLNGNPVARNNRRVISMNNKLPYDIFRTCSFILSQ